MPKLTYQVENAPGRIYGKNANELVFKEPSANAVIYSTSTETGWVTSTRKHLWRGKAGAKEKDGAICIATIDEPSPTSSTATLAVHPSRTAETAPDEAESDETEKLRLKSTWFGSNNRTVTFRGVTYTWTGTSKITDRDGKIVARMAKPWFYQGKLGDLEVDLDDGGDGGREVLEMVLATYVLRWWEDKVRAEKAAEEAKEQKAKEKKAAAQAAAAKKQQDKKEGADDKAKTEGHETAS
ncbi:hypothetical protein KVR01_013010 [Diaporthe batatas]|uniref:uncharacterized protein n=1 Tax=Diaporthe batatas TaxID=748121 RepID=UPI001D049670|nr:uncharacterized protein KVR01_013010 [Diaporthe batatas]KAG8157020.1 hypothetical protein KVR01_013010 [Diaporthe batatas]